MSWRRAISDAFDRLMLKIRPPEGLDVLRNREIEIIKMPDGPAKYLRLCQVYKEMANGYAILTTYSDINYHTQVEAYRKLSEVNRDRYIEHTKEQEDYAIDPRVWWTPNDKGYHRQIKIRKD